MPSKWMSLHGLVERAAQLDQLLQRRGDHFDLGHVFARPRHVVDRLGRSVKIPFARLVEQFERVFDVGRQSRLARLPSSWRA